MTTVYTDPLDPDAPQEGDLVVGLPGDVVGPLLDVDVGAPWTRWLVLTQDAPVLDGAWVHQVRRPTPEELAAHQLSREIAR